MRNRDYEKWLADVEYWVRIKTSNPFYLIDEDYDNHPLGEMFRDDWSAGDAADEIISINNDPGYDAWTKDYYRESVVTMEKDTLWQEIYK